MADTAAGQRLTDRYRAGQIALRARALRQVAGLWRVVDPTSMSSTVAGFAASAAAIVLGYARDAAIDTVDFLPEFRAAEGVDGPPPAFQPVTPPAVAEVAGLIRGAAITGIVNARRRGANLTRARHNGLVKALGTSGRVVMDGGRLTLITGARGDPRALGWERRTSSGACSFCLMLASRGPVYKSERTAEFEAHGHCACTGEIVYAQSDDSARLAAEWERATEGKSGRDARIAWRRHVGGRA